MEHHRDAGLSVASDGRHRRKGDKHRDWAKPANQKSKEPQCLNKAVMALRAAGSAAPKGGMRRTTSIHTASNDPTDLRGCVRNVIGQELARDKRQATRDPRSCLSIRFV